MTSTVLRAGLLLAALITVSVLAATLDLPSLDQLRAWIAAAGPLAPIAFAGGFALLVLMPVPKSVFSALAGVAFGLPLGVLVVVLGGTAGAVLAFLAARALGRDAVVRLAGARMARLDEILQRRGMLAALLVRFIPIMPFTALNYACGTTGMRLRHFTAATALSMIPGTTVLVALGQVGGGLSLWLPLAGSLLLGALSLAGGYWWQRRRPAPASVGDQEALSLPTSSR